MFVVEGKPGVPYIAFGLLFFEMFFGALFPAVVGAAAFAVGAYLLVIRSFFEISNRSLRFDGPGYLWIVFAVVALITHIAALGVPSAATLVFVTTIGLALVSSMTTRWFKPALAVVFAFSSVHAFATLFFYLVPSAFGVFRAVFYSQNTSATGYTSALAENYTQNAMFCSIALLMASARFMSSTAARSRLGMFVYALVCFSAVVLTTKRAHLVFAVIAIVLVFASSNVRGRFFKIAVGGAVGVIAVVVGARFIPGLDMALDRVMGTFQTNDLREATSGRTLIWDYAYRGFLERPVFGHGWGSFSFTWPGGTLVSVHSHNAILNAFYELGVVGGVFVIIVTIVMLVTSLRLVGQLGESAPPVLRTAAYFALHVQYYQLMHAYTSEELFRHPYSFMPYLLSVGIIFALRRFVTERDRNAMIVGSSAISVGDPREDSGSNMKLSQRRHALL